MTTFRAFRILLSLPLVLAAAAFAGHRPPQQDVTAEEYAVYRAVLADSLVSRSLGQVVVMDSVAIRRPTRANDLTAGRSGVTAPMVEDFIERNRWPARLREQAFGAGRPVRLVSQAAADSVLRGGHDDWEKLGTQFGASGIVQFSRVGFSVDGSMAVLTIDRSCEGLCGAGYAVWLERREGRWHVAGFRILWIS